MRELLLLLAAALPAVPASGGSSDVSPSPDSLLLRDSMDVASCIVADALTWLGSPYLYGGTGPAGFDCSGLMYRVFNENGIGLPRTVSAIEAMAEEIPPEELQPGDLLVFENPKHIGLYIGNGEFIHSSSYQDRGVVITQMSQSNYARRFSKAIRIPGLIPAGEPAVP